MEVITNCCFFIHMNVKEFKPKIHLMEIKFKFKFQFITFESEHLLHQKKSILQRTMKRSHIIIKT
jgi:hypothetical protein